MIRLILAWNIPALVTPPHPIHNFLWTPPPVFFTFFFFFITSVTLCLSLCSFTPVIPHSHPDCLPSSPEFSTMDSPTGRLCWVWSGFDCVLIIFLSITTSSFTFSLTDPVRLKMVHDSISKCAFCISVLYLSQHGAEWLRCVFLWLEAASWRLNRFAWAVFVFIFHFSRGVQVSVLYVWGHDGAAYP